MRTAPRPALALAVAAVLAVLAGLLAAAVPASASAVRGGYASPAGAGLTRGRVDMGVDYSGAGTLYALGSGRVVSVYNSGWPGGVFTVIRLDSGRAVYYAEDLAPAVRLGQHVTAGQRVGRAYGGGNGIEIGWANPNGAGNTMAADAGQYIHDGYPTAYGRSMAALLASLARPG